MAQRSTIEWTEATWNRVTGCPKVSPGCRHCCAETFAERFRGVPGHPYERGFDLQLRPERLEQPLKWTQPRMIFVNSMSDLFHEDIPEDYVQAVFKVMRKANWHTFQVFPNCPRYIHKYQLVERSRFVPKAGCETPVPGWKVSGLTQGAVLPAKDP